jgi:hypothetical protein
VTFHSSAFDLYATFESFKEKYPRSREARKHFGIPIVALANDVIASKLPIDPEELPGLRRCLLCLTLRLRWRDHVWMFPTFERRPFLPWPYVGLSSGDNDTALLLVDSLMLTVAKYRGELREFHTNLAPIVLSRVLSGFELACDWADRGVSLTRAKNDVVVPLDVEQLATMLHAPR